MEEMLDAKTIKTILFDVDDTLFDRLKAQEEICKRIYQGFQDLFSELQFDVVREAFIMSDGMVNMRIDEGSLREGVRLERSKTFLRLLGIAQDHARPVTKLYMQLYPKINVPVDGAREVVEALASGFQLGVVSNGFVDIQYHKLNMLGIKELFSCIVLSDEIGIRKPTPDIFLHAAVLLKRTPEECLYVGDSYEYDIRGAKEAGMKACWFNRQGSPAPRSLLTPDMEIGSLRELLHLLDQSM